MRQKRTIVLLLVPAAIFLFLFTILPFFTMFEQSFQETSYVGDRFVGLKNFIETLRSDEYREVVFSSFVYAGIICPVTTFFPLLVALLMYDTPGWFQGYVKFVFFVPSFTTGVIMTNVWRWIFHPRLGLLSYITGSVGMKPVLWMANRWTAIAGMSVMTISGIMGVPLLIYSSGISSINPELFDAARIDGARETQIRLRIVLPLLVPSMLLCILITMMSGFFIIETILLMTGGGYQTATFMYDIFAEGINKQRIGMASARNVIMFFIVLIMVLAKRKLERH